MNKVIATSISFSCMVYLLIGVMGYLTFGNSVSSNIITQYPAGKLVTTAQIAIAFLVLFSFPLQLHPARASLDKILLWGNPGGEKIATGRFYSITISLMFFAYLFAMTVSDLTVVLGLVGATGSTTVCYILPGLFYFKLAQSRRDLGLKMTALQIAAGFMVILGIVIMTISLSTILMGTVSGGH